MKSRGGHRGSSHGAEVGGFLREIRLKRDRVGSFDRYPYSIPAIRTLELLPLDPQITIFVGENGSGKSTLIEACAILAGFNAEGGTKNLRFAARPTESPLCDALTLVRGVHRERTGFFLRAESVFNLATQVQEQGLLGYGWEDLHAKSHGEAFLWLVSERFTPGGLYLLDEPEAALSPQRQLTLLVQVHALARAGSQFVIATHSPILMSLPGALLYEFDSEGIRPIELEDTEHYAVMKAFLAAPEHFLERLLAEETSG